MYRLLKSYKKKNSIILNSFYSTFKNDKENQIQYTVKPNSHWYHKIFEHEMKKPISSKPRKLIQKTMKDSYLQLYLPFKTNPDLLNQYTYPNGKIRTGKLLEDLDALAGAIAYKHIDNGDPDASPIKIVTANVDRLDLFLPEAGIEDYKLSGHVTYVGSSSMEIYIEAEMVPENEGTNSDLDTLESIGILKKNTILATRFTMVALDLTQHPTPINPLHRTTSTEHKLFEFAKVNTQRKKRIPPSFNPPSPDERLDIHDVLTRPPQDDLWMDQTDRDCHVLIENVQAGVLIRQAFELAHLSGLVFMGSWPSLLSMDEVVFRIPVKAGSVLGLKSRIVLSEGYPHRTVQVRVLAELLDRLGPVTVGAFYFTLASGDHSVKLRRVLPKTYLESLLWVEAKRRRFQGVRVRHAMLEAGTHQSNT